MPTLAETVPITLETDPVATALGKEAVLLKFNQYALRLVKHPVSTMKALLAEELVAEVCLWAVENKREYDSARGSVPTWLNGVMSRMIRKRKTKAEQLQVRGGFSGDISTLLSAEPPPGASAEQASEWQRVQVAMDKLPEIDRRLIMGSYYDDLTSTILADETGLSRGNVRVKLHRAIQKIQCLLNVCAEGQS
ncbi:hypothetical protein BH11PLA2_BH11PLA2_50920 [soil metagenome]